MAVGKLDKTAEAHDKPTTHARERKPRKGAKRRERGGAVEGRIAHIETMMHDLTFVTGKTVKQLAAQWGLAKPTVAHYAAEASRRVRASVIDDKDHINATIGQALDTALRSAMKNQEWRVVAQLAATWAQVSGAGAASRTEVSGAHGGPLMAATVDLGSLTTEQLKRVAAGDLTALASDGGAGGPPSP